MGIDVRRNFEDSYSGEGHINVFGHNYTSIGQGTWAYVSTANQHFYGVWRNSSSADADNLTFKVYLAAGTYVPVLLDYEHANGGIAKVDVDGTTRITHDSYAAVTAYNISTAGTAFAVTTSGIYDVTFKCDGKNGASGDYYVSFSCLTFYRTA